MAGILGIALTFAMVFGGYLLAGGKMMIILHSLPYEMMIIGGAAIGAFLVANDMKSVRQTLSAVKMVFTGPHWKSSDYKDLLCLLFELIRFANQNPVAIEAHIEAPHESDIFTRYPKILDDDEAVGLICDTLRSASMNFDDPRQVEEVLEKRIEADLHHAMHPSHALQTMADALPALGIVAAVLGVIKTMASIDQPPEILGRLIGSALVGTFLGVFLAYGIVGPFAARVKAAVEEDHHFYQLIREVLVANLHKHPTNLCIEVGRQNTPGRVRSTFSELELALREVRQGAA
jgi:chemotaxis protein MotA